MIELLRLKVTSVDKIEPIFTDDFSKELISLWKQRELQGEVLVYEDDITIRGFLLVELTEDEAINRGLVVSENRRGKGIGNLLLDFLHRRYHTRFIWTNITKGSDQIYQKFNYIPIGYRKELEQTVAYYPESRVTLSKINKLRQKVD